MTENKNKLFKFIESVLSEGASDLHISEDYPPMMRVSDSLFPIDKKQILEKDDVWGFLLEFLGEKKANEFLEKQEADFSYSYKDNEARFRGNAFFNRGKIAIALRLIPGEIKSLSELNLPMELENFAKLKQGFFLVVGPVGHGKTTTTAAMIDLINKERSEHIITIEDPIEYTFNPDKSIVHQREVGIDTKNFEIALRSIFREDIDVMFIGEMRGKETIETAVTAGETGHLVFSTLHTNNAAQTVDRIIDSFPANQQDQIRFQLAGSLVGIFSQRLVPRISSGRVPAFEILINNNAVSNLIREGRTHEINTVIETSAEKGMISMDRSLADLVRRNEITIENAKNYSVNSKNLNSLV